MRRSSLLLALALPVAVILPLALAGGPANPTGRVVPLLTPSPEADPPRFVSAPIPDCRPGRICCGQPHEWAILVDEGAVWAGSNFGDRVRASRHDEARARHALAGFLRGHRESILGGRRRVEIAAGPRASYGDLLAVIDVARENGFEDVRVTLPADLRVRLRDEL